MNKIRVTAVSYLNTKPLLYGILNHPVKDQIELSLDIPSECARKLQTGDADLGLVPVAILPKLPHYQLISDFCIGTVGAVKTVCLYADRPMEEWDTILLDHHSRTSIELTKILCKHHWKINPAFIKGEPGYIQQIGRKTAGLVIGDRTINLDQRFSYVYDLGEAWQAYTQLPFVFAAWVSTSRLSESFIESFNTALKTGVDSISQLQFLLPNPHPDFDLIDYFTHFISYDFDVAKQQALDRFLSQITQPSTLSVS